MQKPQPRLSDAREIALDILYRVEHEGLFATHLLNELHQKDGHDPHQRALAEKIIKGVLENHSQINGILDSKLAKGISSLPDKVQVILRMGIYQLQYLDRVAVPVVVDSAVALAKRHSSPAIGKLVNAVLRGFLREKDSRPTASVETASQVSTEFSHPLWIVEMWERQIGLEETTALCRWNNTPAPLTVRVNSLRSNPEELAQKLKSEGIPSRPGKYARDSLVLEKSGESVQIHKLASFQEGLFFVQDEGASLVGQIAGDFNPHCVVDLCSAPGGKATHIATAIIKTDGKVIAVDPSEKRLKYVRENAERLGLSNVECVRGDGRDFDAMEMVDLVLVDAPCSGLGVVGKRADLRWQRGRESLEELRIIQQQLLEQAARLLRKGGRIIYSTCTTSEEENEGSIKEFLSRHPEFRVERIEGIDGSLITEDGFLRTWPQRHGLGGGFAAVLQFV